MRYNTLSKRVHAFLFAPFTMQNASVPGPEHCSVSDRCALPAAAYIPPMPDIITATCCLCS